MSLHSRRGLSESGKLTREYDSSDALKFKRE